MVGFHHARNAENVGLGRNESAARLGGDDGTLCEDSGLLVDMSNFVTAVVSIS